MSKNNLQKLELTWIGKGEEPKLEPRILIENPKYSYGDANNENILIHGDNLLALKALEQDYSGKVKCVFIDPPYNTGGAFEHYDDGIEHSLWLNLIKPRLEILKKLLSNDGSIWISIDDDESHYLKVLCDEVFGRKNFIANIVWQKKFSPQNDAKWFSDMHDHILVYAKNKEIWRPNLLPRTEEMDNRYKNPDNDPRGVWTSSDLTVKRLTEKDIYEIITPSGKSYYPPKGRSWNTSKTNFEQLVAENRVWFGVKGDNMPRLKRFITNVKDGITPLSLWLHQDVGHNQEAKKEVITFNSENIFATPKPERLIERVIHIASNKNDIILDSFLGSGTTSAVAHKMGRRHIGIELGEHAKTHCYPRLKAVVDGEQGGISKAVNWQGGGGFKFYTLAPSLLKKDKFGNWVISEDYNPDMLAAAMAKQEGFKYLPHESVFWKQGYSTEQDFIFTTTQFLTVQQLEAIADGMQPEESLLICCKAFQDECQNKFKNITIKKIPLLLLERCEFGKEDYSLNIINVPFEQSETEEDDDYASDDNTVVDNNANDSSNNAKNLFD